MYDFQWHERHAHKTRRSAEEILSTLRAIFPFESALDIGCGSGLWLDAAQRLGCAEIRGVDGPWTNRSALLIPIDTFAVADLAQPLALGRRFDLAMSLEVAEHVDPAASDLFVDNLVAHADYIVFGAAIPYQGGFRHINERWPSFWRQKFAARGYECFDVVRPLIWDMADIHYWYKQNLLVYVNRARTDLVAKVAAFMEARRIVGFPTDMVHPEKYESIASYDQIAFRPLARRLPARLGAKLKTVVLRQA